MGGRWTPAVKTLVIACVVGFLLQIFDRLSGAPSLADKFGLVPAEMEPGLLQSEEFEVVDEESAEEHRQPPGPEGDPDEVVDHTMGDRIDDLSGFVHLESA